MLILCFQMRTFFKSKTLNNDTPKFLSVVQSSSISSLKVQWRKDPLLDSAIDSDKRYHLISRVVREVLNEPGRVIPLRYLENRRARLKLYVKARTFISHYPSFFDVYMDRIKPKTELVPFLRPSEKLNLFLSLENEVRKNYESLAVEKICKLLMMSKDKVISAEKLTNVKRYFGFPDDFLVSLVPRYGNLFRLVGDFLELVEWKEEYAKSVIEKKAEVESEMTGIKIRPNFKVKLPPGFYLRKEMREWVRDWLELPYVSPYGEVSELSQASPEMEKRTIGVLHEVLSLTLLKRMPVPIVGKFCEEYRLSNAFGNAFTRHSGIFYVSLKGGVKTAEEPSELEVVCIEARKLVPEKEAFVLSPRFEFVDEDETQFWLDSEESSTTPLNHYRNPFSRLEILEEEEEEEYCDNEDTYVNRAPVPSAVNNISMSLRTVSLSKKSKINFSVSSRSANQQLPAGTSFFKVGDMSDEEWGVFLEKFQELLPGAFRDRKCGLGKQKQRLGTSCQF